MLHNKNYIKGTEGGSHETMPTMKRRYEGPEDMPRPRATKRFQPTSHSL